MSHARASKPPTQRASALAVAALRKKARGEDLTPDEAAAVAECSRPTPDDAVSHDELMRHRKLKDELDRARNRE